jgi:hypothetical protein
MVMTVTKGAVRFISGTMSKNSYTVRTPTATLGIRGTIFVILVLPNGQTWLLLQQGQVTVQNLVGQLMQLNLPGQAVTVVPAAPGAAPPPPSVPGAPPTLIVAQLPGLINIQPTGGGASPSGLPGVIGMVAAAIGAVSAVDISSALAQAAQGTTPAGTQQAATGGQSTGGALGGGTGPATGASDLEAQLLALGLTGAAVTAILLLFILDGNESGTTTTKGP